MTSKEGHLYRIQMIRLKKGVSFVIWIEGIDDFPNSGILQLGGESKGARFEKLSEDLFININNIEYSFENGYFKIYLATPAIFENGWFPKWLNKVSFEGEYNGIKLKLVACVIGRSLAIGGWDVAQNKPKPLRKKLFLQEVYITSKY